MLIILNLFWQPKLWEKLQEKDLVQEHVDEILSKWTVVF